MSATAGSGTERFCVGVWAAGCCGNLTQGISYKQLKRTSDWLNSSRVAILDIHVVRCGRLCGLFHRDQDPARQYYQMEERFLDFARHIGADAAKLEVLMWPQMRHASSIGLPMLAGVLSPGERS